MISHVVAKCSIVRVVLSLQNIGLELQYKTCYARVLDSKRKFLQAATQYYELSQVENVRGGQVNTLSLLMLSCRCMHAEYFCMSLQVAHGMNLHHGMTKVSS